MRKAVGLHYGDLVLDESCLFSSRNGKVVHFTKSERALLLLLSRNPHRLVTRDRLSNDTPRTKPPPPRHLSEAELRHDPPRRLRRDPEGFGDRAGMHERRRHDEIDKLRQF